MSWNYRINKYRYHGFQTNQVEAWEEIQGFSTAFYKGSAPFHLKYKVPLLIQAKIITLIRNMKKKQPHIHYVSALFKFQNHVSVEVQRVTVPSVIINWEAVICYSKPGGSYTSLITNTGFQSYKATILYQHVLRIWTSDPQAFTCTLHLHSACIVNRYEYANYLESSLVGTNQCIVN